MEDQRTNFTEKHHALLFACIVKAVFEQVGEQRGEQIIRKAVRRYGVERGRRMALRAEANKHPLDMGNYLAYTEFQVISKEMHQQILDKVPHVRVCVSGCSWYAAWKESGLLPYGRFYCLEIDEAVVRGFNPDLKLDVIGTVSNGAERCEFVYHDANLTLQNFLTIVYKKKVNPGKKAVMPWEYHLGHLFSTLEKVILEELGDAGRAAVKSGMEAFGARCGEQAVQAALLGRKRDYTVVPGG